MPSVNKTTNYELNQWQGNEYLKRADLNDDNLKIDTQLKENADNAAAKIPKSLATAADQVPVSSGAGAWAVKTLAQIKTWLGLGSAAYAPIVNNLTTTTTGSVLDATQGKVLNDALNSEATTRADADTSLNNLISSMNLIFTNKTVATTDFVSDATYEDYPYKAVITCTGVTADYFADVVFGAADAISGNYAPVTLTSANTVTIYAVEIPSTTITIPTIKCTKAVIA